MFFFPFPFSVLYLQQSPHSTTCSVIDFWHLTHSVNAGLTPWPFVLHGSFTVEFLTFVFNFPKVVHNLHCIPPSCLYLLPVHLEVCLLIHVEDASNWSRGVASSGNDAGWLQQEPQAPVTADHRNRPNEILMEPLVFNQIKAV